jgi:hypothetical protein
MSLPGGMEETAPKGMSSRASSGQTTCQATMTCLSSPDCSPHVMIEIETSPRTPYQTRTGIMITCDCITMYFSLPKFSVYLNLMLMSVHGRWIKMDWHAYFAFSCGCLFHLINFLTLSFIVKLTNGPT